MALNTKYADLHYLVGRLCAEVYPSSSTSIPTKITRAALANPIEAIGMLKLPDTDAIAEIMETMPANPPVFPHRAKIELQSGFWMGYYHQRTAHQKAVALTPADLERAGVTLFGERWQADLTDALGLTDTARIRQMLTGRRPVPPGVAAEIMALLRQKSSEAAALATELERE